MSKQRLKSRSLIFFMLMSFMITMFSFTLGVEADQLDEGVYNLICVDGGRYLNVYAGQDKDGARVCVWVKDGSKEQNFKLINRGGGKYALSPQSSSKGRVLDTYRGNSYKNPLKNGNTIDIWMPSDSPAQEWYITNRGDGKYTIELAVLKDSVITAINPRINNGGVSLQAYNDSNNQLWYLQRVDKPKSNVQTVTPTNDLRSMLGKRLANFSSSAYNLDNPFAAKFKAQCTWYCWGRAYEKTGIRLNTIGPAKTWLDRLNTAGAKAVRDSNQPRANSIAVATAGADGHVLYVEDVIGDTVYYTQANFDFNAVIDNNDGILQSMSKSNFAKVCNGYIYLN
ncbi:MAG: RICIN domain-containing protein [Clostridia bacterium]|nr:RICIN domain-containing protein [Clostridia bacterium]